jgi:hypothetical protein
LPLLHFYSIISDGGNDLHYIATLIGLGFGLYTPRLSHSLNILSQIELVNSAPWASDKMLSFTQRARLGLKWNACQFGAAADFSEIGRNTFATSRNLGAFLRYEF